ncbi:right-handed parallel beta-helix repeat-containing protein [Saccharicrinis sp. FJH62]|uniref:right-handed parallel beta-helix repeat-containing protein n=1 Tax=Saccharicrinis sp. FJH62 TaxID=3344657 RepID=UPI0035D5279A
MNRKILMLTAFGLIALITSCVKVKENITENIVTDVNSPTTLSADKEWTIEGYVSVNSDLVIEPGTVIKFKEDASLNIGNGQYGSLKAIGTADKPIIFTSASSNPESGDWDGIYFYDKNSASASELTYCTVEYGGKESAYDDETAAIELYYTKVKMSHCTIRHIKNCGIYLNNESEFNAFTNNRIEDCEKHLMILSATAAGNIGSGNTFTPNGNYGILILISDVTTNVTWQPQTAPYFVNDWISINGNNAVMTINAGTTIKLKANGAFVVGNEDSGIIKATGTTSNPVTFTSAASYPSKGDWQLILFGSYTKAGSKLDNCIIEYGAGASSDDEDAAIEIHSSNVSVTNCAIRENEGYGIYIWYDITPVISNNTFENNNNSDIYRNE